MKQLMGGAALIALAAGGAHAGGVERSSQSTAILFEEGTYAEMTYGNVNPDVSGVQALPAPPAPAGTLGGSSGDINPAYSTVSFGFKTALSENIDVALILDQPIGADVNYKATQPYVYAGSSATLSANAVTVLGRYSFLSNISLFGGLRFEQASGEVALFNGYSMTTSTESDVGYVLGVAWEKPEIAARVALTYNSAIDHTFTAAELVPPPLPTTTTFTTTVPQSVNLEFQTGIAADTLLFGSVRWVDWSAFDITPTSLFTASGSSLVDFDNDTVTYNIGVGRRFSDSWSGALLMSYEPQNGGYSGNLGPTDGYASLGFAATYTYGKMELTGGARYIWVGDTKTEASVPGVTLGTFEQNSGVAVGFKMAYNF